jgi:predicted  nucleic acid-binding Zn-ribbon protein
MTHTPFKPYPLWDQWKQQTGWKPALTDADIFALREDYQVSEMRRRELESEIKDLQHELDEVENEMESYRREYKESGYDPTELDDYEDYN